MGKWTPTIPNYPPVAGRPRVRKDPATPTPQKLLLLLRIVSSFDRDHGPEDLEQAEADEEQRAAGQGELREGARLALRPARGNIKCASLRLRRDGPCDGSTAWRARPRRRRGRGPPVDCRTDRDWSPSLPKKVDLSSLMGPRGGPRLGTPSCAAATAQSAHSRVARTCAARIGAERLCASRSDRVALPEQPCVLGWRVGGRV